MHCDVILREPALSHPSTNSPDPGPPQDDYNCAFANQRCNAWIFKDGFEGGDSGLW